jgi:hypothetical protein
MVVVVDRSLSMSMFSLLALVVVVRKDGMVVTGD